MSSDEAETTITEAFDVAIPSSVRVALDLEPGDRLRWTVDEEDRLVAEIVRERYGLADDMEPIDIGEETDAVKETESYAYQGE